MQKITGFPASGANDFPPKRTADITAGVIMDMKVVKIGCAVIVLVVILGALAASCGARHLYHRHYHPVRHSLVRHIVVTHHVFHHWSRRRH
ncbi:MAG: hypothetical protein JO362_12200 [Streptomycetaceae bacterium]|nr:hypothetical protein [Streptomycetaceae bacterium]